MTRGHTKVTIKKGEYTADVPERAAEGYTRHGWTLVDDGSSGSKAKSAEEKPKSEKPTSRKAE